MCDSLAVVLPGRVLFAKNSDRDANEAQLLDWQPAREHAPGSRLRCTWIGIPQATRTHAVLLSRPCWTWGAEMGANERGLVVGNEAVFTRTPVPRTGLTGMDLVRLALERAGSAREGVEVIAALLAAHGQGGGCGHERRDFRYHNSFLLADPGTALVLETCGGDWQVGEIRGSRAISNRLALPGFAERHSDRLRTHFSASRQRLAITAARAARASDPADLAALLDEHGDGSAAPRYDWLTGGLAAPCVHAGGLVAASQTTASWISELTAAGCRHWATATAAPCTGLFKPVRVDEPLDAEPAPGDRFDPATLWWRHERLHRAALRDPERALPLFAPERDAIERSWLERPPEPARAFREASERLDDWLARVRSAPLRDTRPWPARRFWRRRDRWAGLPA